jgi:hypothetical protein
MRINKLLIILLAIVLMTVVVKSQTIERSVKLQPPKAGESLFTYVPFEVPPNTKSLSINFDFDKKGGANGLNFGLFETGFNGKDSDKTGLRGYSGYVREVIFIAEDTATHGYRAGKIPAGTWFVLVGLSKIAPEGVELKLKVKFNQIDEKALKQFEAEKAKKFTHDRFTKSEPIKFNGLTWFRGDLHAHCFHGDGSWSVKGILDSAASNGLDFVALTEHNTYTHHYEIDAEKKNYPGLLILRGEEVTTYGAHINVWGLPSGKWVDFRVLPGLEASGKQIAAEAHKLGGLASVNHPTMGCGGCSWTYGDDWSIMDSVEIWNATWDRDDEKALKMWDEFLQKGQMIRVVGSSDSHQPPDEPSVYPTNLRIGEPTVFIGARSLTEKSLFEGIRAGRVFIAENPRYSIKFTTNHNKTIGDKVLVRKNQNVNLKISLDGFPPEAKLLLIADGKVIKESNISGTNYLENFVFSTVKNDYVRLEIRHQNGKMLALTNPIYFRVK